MSGTGCRISVPFRVNPILSVSTSIASYPGDTICAGTTETFTASSLNGGAAPVYEWKKNSYVIPGATSSTYSYSPVNGDVIKCILTSNATCAIPNTAVSNSITMTVNPVTNPTVTMFPGNHDTLCIGTSQTYSVTSTSGGTAPVYLWTVNWIPVASGVMSFNYSPANGDIIRCGMISSSPCPIPDTAFAVDTVVVKPYETPGVNINGVGSLSVCQGNGVTLVANGMNGGWGAGYIWQLNGSVVAGVNGNTLNLIPSGNEVVSVTMTSNYPCLVPSDTASATINLGVDSVIEVSISDSRGGLVTYGTYDTLTANVRYGGSDPIYQWYRNGSILTGANYYQLALNNLSNGDSVSCIVTTNGGTACSGIKGHAWKLLEVAPVSVAELSVTIGQLRILPNPNAGSFKLSCMVEDGSQSVEVQITDMLGQEVFHNSFFVDNKAVEQNVQLDGVQSAGNYLIHLTTHSGSVTKGITIVK